MKTLLVDYGFITIGCVALLAILTLIGRSILREWKAYIEHTRRIAQYKADRDWERNFMHNHKKALNKL